MKKLGVHNCSRAGGIRGSEYGIWTVKYQSIQDLSFTFLLYKSKKKPG